MEDHGRKRHRPADDDERAVAAQTFLTRIDAVEAEADQAEAPGQNSTRMAGQALTRADSQDLVDVFEAVLLYCCDIGFI